MVEFDHYFLPEVVGKTGFPEIIDGVGEEMG